MPITAASDALVRHLRVRLGEAGGLDGWDIRATTLRDARAAEAGRGIALVLWRVQPDEPAGEDDPPARIASQADPPDGGGLVLRYLLLARAEDGRAEQAMLGRCLAVLHRHPVVEGPGAPGDIAATALVVTIETPPDGVLLEGGRGVRRRVVPRRALRRPQRAAAPADGRPRAGLGYALKVAPARPSPAADPSA